MKNTNYKAKQNAQAKIKRNEEKTSQRNIPHFDCIIIIQTEPNMTSINRQYGMLSKSAENFINFDVVVVVGHTHRAFRLGA